MGAHAGVLTPELPGPVVSIVMGEDPEDVRGRAAHEPPDSVTVAQIIATSRDLVEFASEAVARAQRLREQRYKRAHRGEASGGRAGNPTDVADSADTP
jgi:hypothetical protein